MSERADAWEARGVRIAFGDGELFVVDVAAVGDEIHDPALVLHGFPTSSFDWHLVVDDLARDRRVVLFDFPGFGLSWKPDRRYSIELYADAAEAVADHCGLEVAALITHDMGDTVGGELLARDMERGLGFVVTGRVLTNGSIYIDLAQLTPGQEMLLAANDAVLDLASVGLDPEQAFRGGVAATFSEAHAASDDDLDDAWRFASDADGHMLLARTIRYIEDRRAHESRYTGAIETHLSPLGVVWGRLDPVAVYAMAGQLVERRPSTPLVTLGDVAHWPMLEAPDDLVAAVRTLLD